VLSILLASDRNNPSQGRGADMSFGRGCMWFRNGFMCARLHPKHGVYLACHECDNCVSGIDVCAVVVWSEMEITPLWLGLVKIWLREKYELLWRFLEVKDI
jgi:hypothetical protein